MWNPILCGKYFEGNRRVNKEQAETTTTNFHAGLFPMNLLLQK